MATSGKRVYRVRPWNAVRPNLWVVEERPDCVRVRAPRLLQAVFGGITVVLFVWGIKIIISGFKHGFDSFFDPGHAVTLLFGIAFCCCSAALLWKYARAALTINDSGLHKRHHGLGTVLSSDDVDKVVLQLVTTEIGGASAGSWRRSALIWHVRIGVRGKDELMTIHCDKTPHRLKNEKVLAERLAKRWNVPVTAPK